MLKVFNYQMGYTFRKKSNFIFLVILFFVALAIPLLIFMYAAPKYIHTKYEYVLSGPIASTMIPIVLLFVLYICLQVGNIFKKGEADGTTLMLVSSKFIRSDVIVGRFLAILIHVLIVSATVALGMGIASFVTTSKDISAEGVAMISIFIGSIFIGLFFAGLSLLFAIVFGRIGTIVISAFIGVLLPVLSLILVSITTANDAKSRLSKAAPDESSVKYYDNQGTNNALYLDNGSYKVQDIYSGFEFNKNINDAHNASYNRLGWIDIWGQMSGMYSILNKSSGTIPATDNVTLASLGSINPTYWKAVDGSSFSDPATLWRNFVFRLNDFGNSKLYNQEDLYQFQKDALTMVQANDFKNHVDNLKTSLITIQNAVNFTGINNQPLTNGEENSLNAQNFLAMVAAIDKNNIPTSNIDRIELENSSFSDVIVKVVMKNSSSTIDITSDVENNLGGTYERPWSIATVERMLPYALAYFEVNKEDWKYAFKNATVTYSQDSSSVLSGMREFNNVSHRYPALPITSGSIVTFQGKMSHDLSKANVSTEVQTFIPNNMHSDMQKIYENSTNSQQWISGEMYYGQTFTTSPIVPNGFKYIFWPILSIGLFGLAFVIHRRTDFK